MTEQQLPAPAILDAQGDVLDPESLPTDGVTVQIPPYAAMAVGDVISLSWGGTAVTHTVPDNADEGQPIAIQVPADLIAPAGNGDAIQIHYKVERSAGDSMTSEAVDLALAPQE
ncbi:hypothetical protein ACFV9E_43285 [Streptomyces sp. NPDC059835]|uniref:hypothetical protein n=1 Tax=Streptomyces sp. NPDC059835 TaxID=3346967 RepID=UPI003647B36E